MSIEVTSYRHTYCRVEYPQERGYRMEPRPIPDWMSIEIHTDKENDSKQMVVHSRIHVGRVFPMQPVYSCDFSDKQLLTELAAEVSHRFGR